MIDQELRKKFGRRVKQLRKDRGWMQKELALKIAVKPGQLNRYECGLNAPPLETLIAMAKAFGVTLDFLLTGKKSEEAPLHDTRLIECFRKAGGLSAEDQEIVVKLIEAMVFKNKVQDLAAAG